MSRVETIQKEYLASHPGTDPEQASLDIEQGLMHARELLEGAQNSEVADKTYAAWQGMNEHELRAKLQVEGPYLRASNAVEDKLEYSALLKAFRAHRAEQDLGDKSINERMQEIAADPSVNNFDREDNPYKALQSLRQQHMMESMGPEEISQHLDENPEHPNPDLWKAEFSRQTKGHSFDYDSSLESLAQQTGLDEDLLKLCTASEAREMGYRPAWLRPTLQPMHEASEVSYTEPAKPELSL